MVNKIICNSCGNVRLQSSFPGNQKLTCKFCLLKNGTTYDQNSDAAKMFTHIYQRCKNAAKTRKLSCHINPEIIRERYVAQQGKCFWSGVELSIARGASLPNQISVDRLNCKVCYIGWNIVLTTKAMNLGRQSTTPKEWLAFLKQIGIYYVPPKKLLKDLDLLDLYEY